MALLEVTDLHKNFDQLQVLKGISFSLEKGRTLSIIGPSGGGKTTLLRCLNFLEMPSAGKIVINDESGSHILFDGSSGKELKAAQIRRNRLHFGLVFQSFNLFPQYTALQNVSLAPKLQAKNRDEYRENRKEQLQAIESRSIDLLRRVGLGDKLDYYPHQLSGGQQQRVALARTLAQNPKIILADEPVAALDPVTAKQVMEDFVRINQDMDISILLNIHHVELALTYANRIIGIRSGKIVFDGPAKAVTQEVLNAIYEGHIPQGGEDGQ